MFGSLKALKRIESLEERFEKVERKIGSLELEWIDTLDRIKRLMGRVAKRAEVDARPEPSNDGADGSASGGAVTPQLDPVSARILARRRHLLSRGSE